MFSDRTTFSDTGKVDEMCTVKLSRGQIVLILWKAEVTEKYGSANSLVLNARNRAVTDGQKWK